MGRFCYTLGGMTERANALPPLTKTTLLEAEMATLNLRQNDSKSNPRPTYERVRELLSYDPETGSFMRLKRMGSYHPGPVTGGRTEHGYVNITIDGMRNYAHRLAFLLMTGEWPTKHIDHINGDRADNRWANLRQATHSQNLANRGPTKRNKSGFKGVVAKRDKWIAAIQWKGKPYRAGPFESKEQAAEAYREMALRLHGDFTPGQVRG